MPLDGSGNFTRTHDWTDDAAADVNIEASRFDEENDDFATALNTAFYRDGQATATGAFKMNTNRIDFDADEDTSLRSPSDDNLTFEIGGADLLELTAGLSARLISTDAGATGGPDLIRDRDSASPAISDVLGRDIYRGENDAGEDVDYAMIQAEIDDETDATEDGRLTLHAMVGGTLTEIMAITGPATDHRQGHRYCPYVGSTVPAAFALAPILDGAATFESIGPTGAGATNTWDAMDNIPSNAKGIRFLYKIGFTGNGGAGQVTLLGRPGDVSWTGEGATLAGLGLADTESNTIFGEAEVALDPSDLTFDAAISETNATSVVVTIYYKGFYI